MIAKLNANGYISIHALLAESDIQPDAELYTMLRISIHALLAESDFTSVVSSTGTMDFYPRSPCGERQPTIQVQHLPKRISIHALLAESDS